MIHRFTNKDIMDGISELMQKDTADIFYSDPPWGQGNLNYWQTINKRHNGIEPKSIDYNAFLNQIFILAQKYTKGIIFIEYGIKWADDVKNIGEMHGLTHLGVATIKYPSGNKFLPHHLHVFTNNGSNIPVGYLKSIEGETGIKGMIKFIQPFSAPGKTVLDCCCGLGLTARVTIKLGMRFLGNELNITRLNRTMDYVNKNSKDTIR